MGAKFRPLRRENIIASVDPDVIVKSRILADAENYAQLQIFTKYVQIIAHDPTANLRYAEKEARKTIRNQTRRIKLHISTYNRRIISY